MANSSVAAWFRRPQHISESVTERGPGIPAPLSLLPSLAVWPAPRVVLVTSDLHLGDASTTHRSNRRGEERCPDAAFRRWLNFYKQEASEGALLVLNGDTFDFLRAFKAPRTPEDFGAWAALLPEQLKHKATASGISRAERRFGLKAEVHKSVWKVHAIAAAHPKFFAAIADWISRGGRLLVVKGNHDLELHWLEVCNAVTHELTTHMSGIENAANVARERILFSEEGVTLDNIWIEHGHRWESHTAVSGAATSGDALGRLRVPRSAVACKYLFNVLDRGQDAVQGRFGLPLLLSLMARGATALLLHGFIEVLIPVLLFASMMHRSVSARISALIHGIGSGLLSRRSVRNVARGAREVLSQPPVTQTWPVTRYAVMGHTHVQQVSQLSTSSGPAVYVNTGSWSPGWSLSPRKRKRDPQYRFAKFLRENDNVYSFSALVWDEVNGTSRHAVDKLAS